MEGGDGVEEHALHRAGEQLHQGGDTPGLEDGEQALPVHRQVVQGAHGALRRLQVVGVGDGLDEGGDHLGAVHDGVPRGLLLAELVDHHGGLADHHLVLVVQQLDEFGDGPGGQVGVVLVVDEVDHGVLEHLAGLGQPLDGGGLGGVELGRGDLQPLLQSLGEHGGPDPLAAGLVQLLVHLVHLLLGVGRGEALVHVEHDLLPPAAGVHLLGVVAGEAVGLGGGPGLDAGVGAHVVALLPHVDLLLGPQVLALRLVALALAPSQGALHGVAHPRAFGGAAGRGTLWSGLKQ